MATVGQVTVSPNAIAYGKTSYHKYNIKSINYDTPSSVVGAIFINILQNVGWIVIVIGIPFIIIKMVKDHKYYKVDLIMNERDRKGQNNTHRLWVTKEEYDFIRENY